MSKKRTKREEEKYPALKPHLNLKTRYDLYDMDYIDKLSDKEKDFMNRFMEEWAGANFKHEGKKLDRSKKARKDSYDRNNSRNRCILTKAKASGRLTNLENLRKFNEQLSPEEAIIMEEKLKEILFNEKELKKIKKNKKLLEDLKDRLKELELMKNQLQKANSDPKEGQD